MTDSLLTQVLRYGWHVTSARSAAEVLRILLTIGEPTGDRRTPDLYRIISPRSRAAARPNTLSSRYGTGSFPYHTDAAYWREPARFLALHCVDPGPGERQTLLIDSAQWTLSDSERRHFTNAVWRSDDYRPFLCTIARERDYLAYRWDQDCMMAASLDTANAGAMLRTRLARTSPVAVDWSKDLLLVLDNHRCFHARGEARGPDGSRRLGRVLVRARR